MKILIASQNFIVALIVPFPIKVQARAKVKKKLKKPKPAYGEKYEEECEEGEKEKGLMVC